SDQAVVMRAWAEKREQTGEKELLSASGKKVGKSTVQETTYVAHLEVLHPSSQTMVIEMSGEATVDPFSEEERDGADPAPELTALVEKLAAAAFDELSAHASTARAPKPLGFTYAVVPKQALKFARDDGPPYEVELAQKDAVEQDLFIDARVRYANP